MTNGKMIKILYAEDDAMQAKTCIDYLKRAGYKVVHAADGEQALWLYRRETPDLILLDVLNSSYKCNGIHINNLFKFFVWCEVSKSFTRSII